MFNIDKYLQKFSKGVASIEFNKGKIIEIINKYTKLSIQSSQVEIKDYKIFVNTTSVGKNQLFIMKSKILNEINSSIPVKIVDIK